MYFATYSMVLALMHGQRKPAIPRRPCMSAREVAAHATGRDTGDCSLLADRETARAADHDPATTRKLPALTHGVGIARDYVAQVARVITTGNAVFRALTRATLVAGRACAVIVAARSSLPQSLRPHSTRGVT